MNVLLLMALAGCSAQSQTSQQQNTITPIFAFSEAVVGPNRIALGLIKEGSPINDPDAKVHLRFFRVGAENEEPQAEADAFYYGQGLPAAVYVAYVVFDTAGDWNVEIQAQSKSVNAPSISKLRLQVLADSQAPKVGTTAISTKTPTIKDTPPDQLSSGKNPDLALYKISLDEALTSGKPTAVLFATPAYCRTAVCSPSVTVLSTLQKQYGNKVNIIHAEVYKYPFDQSLQQQATASRTAQKENRSMTVEEQRAGFSDAMNAWALPTEPWLYLIDAKGTIAARYEGGITVEELGPAMQALVEGAVIMPVPEGTK